MNKQDFLEKLRQGLSGLPEEDAAERLTFYSEMIDDRIEDGMPEEAAVGEIGTVEEIVAQTVADIPLARLVKEKVRPKAKLKVWEIVLLVLGSPIWLSLLIAVFAVLLSVYISLWSAVISLWAVFVSLVGGGLSCAAAGILFVFKTNILTGIAVFGAGLFGAGLSVLMFFGCKAVTKGLLIGTKKSVLQLKNSLLKKEEAQ